MDQRRFQIGAFLVGCTLLLTTLLFIVVPYYIEHVYLSVVGDSRFVTTQGRVETATWNDRKSDFYLVASYSYKVGDQTYKGRRVGRTSQSGFSYASQSVLEAQLTPGAEVSVAYVPQNPLMSFVVIDRTHEHMSRTYVYVACIVLAAIVCGFFGVRLVFGEFRAMIQESRKQWRAQRDADERGDM